MANAAGSACGGMRDHADQPSRESELLCIKLSRELRCANVDYRSLALHAGPLHSMTLDAKRRAVDLATLLWTEDPRHFDDFQ